jgi:hypothetical protein
MQGGVAMVKMTSQFATKNTYRLGMTTNGGILDRYIETPSPGRPSIEKHLGAVEKPISVTLRDTRYEKIELIKFPTFCYLIREHKLIKLRQMSLRYQPDGKRAKQDAELGRVRNWRTISRELGRVS